MSESDLSSPTPTPRSASELDELQELCADLRWQLHTLRIALLVVACALCGFFWLEARRNSQALTLLRPQAAQVLELSKAQDPNINRFIGQIMDFGKTHADFAAILKKYPIQAGPVTNQAATAPTATVPAAPKK